MVSLVEFLGIPGTIATCIIALVFGIQLIGEIMEFFGKTVPEIMKIRKIFKRKKEEKKEMKDTLANVQKLLSDVNKHYDKDNITKRDEWIKWVNDQADTYNSCIATLEDKYDSLLEQIKVNNSITQEMYLDNKRSMILECAARVNNPQYNYSKEYFNKIFKVYDEYEQYITKHNLKNGEVDIAYSIIQKAYENKLKNNLFAD